MCPPSRGPPFRAAPCCALAILKPAFNRLPAVKHAITDLSSRWTFTKHMPSAQGSSCASKFGSKLIFGDVVVENTNRRSLTRLRFSRCSHCAPLTPLFARSKPSRVRPSVEPPCRSGRLARALLLVLPVRRPTAHALLLTLACRWCPGSVSASILAALRHHNFTK